MTKAERTMIEGVMSKATSVGDSVGKLVRDIRLLKRLNPVLDRQVLGELTTLESGLLTEAFELSRWEGTMADVLNTLLPPGGRGE